MFTAFLATSFSAEKSLFLRSQFSYLFFRIPSIISTRMSIASEGFESSVHIASSALYASTFFNRAPCTIDIQSLISSQSKILPIRFAAVTSPTPSHRVRYLVHASSSLKLAITLMAATTSLTWADFIRPVPPKI